MTADEEQEAPVVAAAPAEADQPAELDLHEGETSYSYSGFLASQRRSLLWAITITIAAAALGVYLGYLSVPTALRDGSSKSGAADLARLGFMGTTFAGFIVLTGLIACGALAWPKPGYGPKREPKPLPLWLGLLRLAALWLAMLPFSGLCLLLVSYGILAAVDDQGAQAAIRVVLGLGFGFVAFVLLAGSGVAAGADIKPGGKVPDKVRKSKWWRHFLWILALWATLLTVGAIIFGVQGKWSDFGDSLTTAVGSWIALAVASGGEMPEDALSG